MKTYLDLVKKIIDAPESAWKGNRTGVRAKSISGYMLEHDMSTGFPLLTTKQVPLKMIAVELEGFIKGITNKKWFQERGCHIWDEWCNPEKVPYSTDKYVQDEMKAEMDLGKIYGFQWRKFNGTNGDENHGLHSYEACARQGYDQLKVIVDRLHNNPSDRRMICTAWNPEQLDEMALPPCHLLWQVVVTGENYDTLNLNWYQRSCDTMLGIPFNLASYALLLVLLAKDAGMKQGKLCGMLGDVHIYENQFETAKTQIKRQPLTLPEIEIPDFTNIYDWTYKQRKLINYKYLGKIEYNLSV